jgi:aldoxime dehydratase
MTEIGADGELVQRTFGHGLFLSPKRLEDWARSHRTQLSIVAGFLELLKMRGNQISLRLWHEVAVLPGAGQYFEYISCQPRTGLISSFD